MKGKLLFVTIKKPIDLKTSSVFTNVEIFRPSDSEAFLRNKRMLATGSRVTQEITRIGQSQKLSVPGITEEYVTQISE